MYTVFLKTKLGSIHYIVKNHQAVKIHELID